MNFDRRPSTILAAWSKPEGEIDEAEEKKKAAAAKKAKEAAEMAKAAGQPVPKPDPFDAEIKSFQHAVTIGDWVHVKAFIAEQEKDHAKAAYKKLLTGLLTPPKAAGSPQLRLFGEQNRITFDDLFALADAAPLKLEKEQLLSLGALLRNALKRGNMVEAFLNRLRGDLKKPQKERVFTPRQMVRLLVGAGHSIRIGEFLPKLAEAKKNADHEAMNFLSVYHMALYAKKKKVENLEAAWRATQAVFATGKIKKAERIEALTRAVDLAPKIRKTLGQTWLDDSFTKQPQRGMSIIAAIGSAAARSMQKGKSKENRLTGLKLQTTAVKALLAAAPKLAKQWQDSLHLLALNWLKEAEHSYTYDTSSNLGPSMRRDMYGNYYYNYFNRNRRVTVQPIRVGDILEITPDKDWLALVKESVKPKFSMVLAQLYLKVQEDKKAFPYIEKLAHTHPDRAKELVDEFLRVWTKNHNPNSNRNRTNPYMYMYGFDRRRGGIPLTRSKQQRNLAELAELIKRLRALPIEDPDEKLLALAFTTCHSSAEVYRIEAIENVFGSIKKLEPETLAELVQQMRSNLIGVWRQPATQKAKKTKRKQKDIQAEVLRGYGVASQVIDHALLKHPENWSLQLAKASIAHDENNYRQELQLSSEFTAVRADALAGFEKAAKYYAVAAKDLSEDKESTEVYEFWYYASLGAVDLKHVSHKNQLDPSQPKKIREAMLALPGPAAERHIQNFASKLFTRMSAVNPAAKHRYLSGGFEIVGNHQHAYEARKVYDYYRDLVSEIKLVTVIDGTDQVGHGRPFGLFVNLVHTREIERESGGFGKYLQNQNVARSFSYNYGRPLENYRDKFQEAAEAALKEHFEIISVTFQKDDVNSRAIPDKYGWRVTPYAYLLLKPHGPEVDTIPSLQIDLDFLDTSGYVVLPIASAQLPIDASSKTGETRPFSDLEITQTLDERQAKDGKLILEIKVVGNGLVPELDEIVDLNPGAFDITETKDQGLSVNQFDEDSAESQMISERSWMVTLRAKQDLEELPEEFRFASLKHDDNKPIYQRYVDADLIAVEQTIKLDERYGKTSNAWIFALVAGIGLVGGLLFFIIRRGRREKVVTEVRGLLLPEQLTAFTVLGLLRDIRDENQLSEAHHTELATIIDGLEQHYFRGEGESEPNLRAIAEEWLMRIPGGHAEQREIA